MGRTDGAAGPHPMSDTPQRPRRLPLDMVVKRAFLYAWESREVLMAPSLIYAAVIIASDLIGEAVAGPKDLHAMEILFVFQSLITASFAVGIYRFVLLNEAP